MSMDWNQIELFKGIDLNDSFVLNWLQEGARLRFDLEASIWPDSLHYSKPENDEYTCYRKATLIYTGVQTIVGLKPVESMPSTAGLDGETDFGNIDTFIQTENGFQLSGDFGSVNIVSGELRFEVHT